MSNSRSKELIEPDGWADVFVRTVVMFLIAFVTLTFKEWLETREFDVPACLVDAGCIAAGTFVFYAILAVTAGGERRAESRLPVTTGR